MFFFSLLFHRFTFLLVFFSLLSSPAVYLVCVLLGNPPVDEVRSSSMGYKSIDHLMNSPKLLDAFLLVAHGLVCVRLRFFLSYFSPPYHSVHCCIFIFFIFISLFILDFFAGRLIFVCCFRKSNTGRSQVMVGQ